MPGKLRTIVRDPQFDEELRQIIPVAQHADEFVTAAEFTLARNPEIGLQARPGSDVWCIPVHDVPGVTPVILYYAFNEEKVMFLSIKETEPYPE